MVTEANPCDVCGQAAHPVGIGGDVDCGDYRAKVACHRRLPRQKAERAALDPVVHGSKLLDVEDDTTGHLGIDVQQSVGGAPDRVTGESAHGARVCAQQVELTVKVHAHEYSSTADESIDAVPPSKHLKR
jgi:hypothetical protein